MKEDYARTDLDFDESGIEIGLRSTDDYDARGTTLCSETGDRKPEALRSSADEDRLENGRSVREQPVQEIE
jgi:hypothetical protein